MKPKDLKHPNGTWYSKGEAVDWSIAFAAERSLLAKVPRGRRTPGRIQRLSLAALVDAWSSSAKWQDNAERGLKAATKRDYRQKLKAFAAECPKIWTAPAESITRPILQNAYDTLEASRGLATAAGAIAVLGSCFKWAITRGKIRLNHNPAAELDKQMPAPRIRFGTRREILSLIAAADDLGLPYLGDAIMLGLWTSQRQADRLKLKLHGRIGKRRVFKQSKTGAIVAILEAPELEARLTQSLERRGLAGRLDPHVILNERTWAPYQEDTYRHDFARVRAAAIASCPSLAGFQDRDLRDTGVTWMALAGATIPEIAAVTGHSAETVHVIMKHYLAQHPEMADSAIRKMIDWFDRGGETEIG